MDRLRLQNFLERVRAGSVNLEDALRELKDLPFANLGYATVDHHRALRQGTPEVIFGLGKTAEQIVGIAQELARTGQNVMITRLDPEKAAAVTQALPGRFARSREFSSRCASRAFRESPHKAPPRAGSSRSGRPEQRAPDVLTR